MVVNAGAESTSIGLVWDQSQYLLEKTAQGVLLPLLLVGLLTLIIWTFQRKGTSEYLRTKSRFERKRYIPNCFPPVLPNGWIPVLESSKLKVNMVKTLNIAGLELVAFRTGDGVAHVVNAFCPHLEAHLGVMGRVVGDCIECPFHGWKFRGKDGACTHVPYASKLLDFAKVLTWPCREVFPFLFVWHHAEGDAPSWEPPDAAETIGGPWRIAARFERNISAHFQDIAENIADYNHLNQVHAASFFLGKEDYLNTQGSGWKGHWIQHSYKATWSDSGTTFTVQMEVKSKVLGIELDFLTMRGYMRIAGPAYFHSCMSIGKRRISSCISVTPTSPFTVHMVHYLLADANFPWILAKMVDYALRNMVDRDILIWNTKAYHQKPALVEEDKGIAAFRRWYAQFYSPNSPTWKDLKNRTLEL